jgi:hypothetical protein
MNYKKFSKISMSIFISPKISKSIFVEQEEQEEQEQEQEQEQEGDLTIL